MHEERASAPFFCLGCFFFSLFMKLNKFHGSCASLFSDWVVISSEQTWAVKWKTWQTIWSHNDPLTQTETLVSSAGMADAPSLCSWTFWDVLMWRGTYLKNAATLRMWIYLECFLLFPDSSWRMKVWLLCMFQTSFRRNELLEFWRLYGCCLVWPLVTCSASSRSLCALKYKQLAVCALINDL